MSGPAGWAGRENCAMHGSAAVAAVAAVAHAGMSSRELVEIGPATNSHPSWNGTRADTGSRRLSPNLSMLSLAASKRVSPARWDLRRLAA